MWKYIAIGVLLVVAAFILFTRSNNPKISPSLSTPTPSSTGIPNNVNFIAQFEIYTKGTKRVFTDPRYHNKSPDVYIESSATNLVVVKKEGIKWKDFFATLPMKLEKKCLVTGTNQTFCTGESGRLMFYINEKEDADALDKDIKEGDFLRVEFVAS